ncbi:MAG: DEAD/DEAH box helicase [Burkholderiales bacterium]|nr:DEAD/DEAH box helicase [Burkholderiales bacterium]
MNARDTHLDPLAAFHPALAAWFRAAFDAPTQAQSAAWPAIHAGRDVLIAAPTGSGKTLAAFLAAIDQLVREGLRGALGDETRIVYVSPLKALSNDIQRNLDWPLAGIQAELKRMGLPGVPIRAMVRTGDTPQGERDRMRRQPPHIVVTTPESLYILLGAASGRKMLATTRTVIVDEIHALAPDKRGSHLALSVERLCSLAGRRLTRIGLSATQKPVELMARFLVGADPNAACTIVDAGHARRRDLAIELPPTPLEAVMSTEAWSQVYDRVAQLVEAHRTTLVFVNTRRLAERAARHLSERLGAEHVSAHHGSMARDKRLEAEQRLKRGELKALVATASLELGIDIGDVDLVCQLGSTRTIAALLQRVGRAGHSVAGTPKGRLFPTSRDDLLAAVALLDSIRRGELDRIAIPQAPLDVLAQQIVAEVACGDIGEDELYALACRAYPYRGLTRAAYADVVRMLAEGYTTRRGRHSAYIHRDAVNRRLSARRGARLTAITSAGTIPDNADYDVILEPDEHRVGSVNEDFAVESLPGDIFQLGNTSYRLLRIEAGRVRVADAAGLPPTIPFWLGEAPARSDELSLSVSRLVESLDEKLQDGGRGAALEYLLNGIGIGGAAAEQLVDYLFAARSALGVLPTLDTIVLERFFDESGGMQLVIHSRWGSRINRAWGLALRKRFCRKFNFELQAAATEDAIVLSLGTSHSFPLDEVAAYLHSGSVRPLLIQALLAAPMFATRWRWNASIALALPRARGSKKVPTQLQRMIAEDLMAAVFPDQLACAENIVGDREIPDDPLVQQTLDDCLTVAMDAEGLERVLAAREAGRIRVLAKDVTEPSPLAMEILAARPYAFLDDAPLEERRTQAVLGRRWLDPDNVCDLGRLDESAIARVREEAWPSADSAAELHDALLWMHAFTQAEIDASPGWGVLLQDLAAQRRVVPVRVHARAPALWSAVERLPVWRAAAPASVTGAAVSVPSEFATPAWEPEAALTEIVRGRLEGSGPTTAAALATPLGFDRADVDGALLRLETEGFAMRGRFTAAAADTEWCERRLLARIHRYTVKRLRAEIEPVSAADCMRFLLNWQHVASASRMAGPDAVAAVIGVLEGFEAPAVAWETALLPARVSDYEPQWLDELCLKGRAAWMRLSQPRIEPGATPFAGSPVRVTPIALVSRRNLALFAGLVPALEPPALRSPTRAVYDYLAVQGASFFDEIVAGVGLLRTQVEESIGELVSLGLLSSDSFIGLRALLLPQDRRKPIAGGKRRRRSALFGIEDAGRWTLTRRAPPAAGSDVAEHVARTLLKRYGVVFWRLLEREASWLPPWRDLLRALRRLEARGEIRGGRFVGGVWGEQFALPEAVTGLREARRAPRNGELVAVCGADPLNLAGILTPGPRVPALTGNRVLYRDGTPIAWSSGGSVELARELDAQAQREARDALIRRHALAPALGFLA